MGTLELLDDGKVRCATHGGEYKILFRRAQPPSANVPPVLAAVPGMCANHSNLPAVFACKRCGMAICSLCAFRRMTAAGSVPIAPLCIRPGLNLRHTAGFPPSLWPCRTGNAGNTPMLPRFKSARPVARRCAPPVIFCCPETCTSVPIAPPASGPCLARNGRHTSLVPLRWAFGACW